MKVPTIANTNTGYVYILKIAMKMGENNYYVADLKGSLSRNVQDSMLFCNEIVADSYAGIIEKQWEEQMTTEVANPTIHVERIQSSSIIPRTTIESIPCP